ncbi:hypothetical protein N7448_001845 [Penicillium atrosanguineum]|uniref:Uncharacterized protein n=1 Tax=Penicillium atrosanguineum TaxID=1132637 RepID=A0A9W9LE10_9EURO|nr:hypothetical protein N7448_001845 [Penicillium atrosanguineum]KAJ5325045.1 hypothetical protein N7476_003645 [Penicillium atrosanguineum]
MFRLVPSLNIAGDVHSRVCEPCRAAGVACDRSTIRFREGLTLPKEPEVAFPGHESWPQLHGKVRFHDETPEIASLYLDSLEARFPRCVHDTIDRLEGEERETLTSNELHTQPHAHVDVCPPFFDSTTEDLSPSSLSLYSSPSFQANSAPKNINPLTERETILLRNFVENMALWADITDPHRHFESEVPARALREPVLRCAMFAFSSRHLNRQNTSDIEEALQYHSECVSLLIPALSEPEQHITEDLLAAVAILRQHEEMDGEHGHADISDAIVNHAFLPGEDNQFHLIGTTHILNTVSTFGSSGGLGEAAAWLCLRQDIYVSLISQKPLRTSLQNFHDSSIFKRDDDFAWSNRMVFLLAKALQSAFSRHSEVELAMIDGEVEAWYASKPHTFQPVRVAPRGPGLDQRFPLIWMLLPVHVVGLQYYHIAKIVLALSESSKPSSAYDKLRQSRAIEKNIRQHLLQILGLAQSNTKAENTLFTARHSLVAWGWVLRNRSDQAAAESLLRDMHARTGWNMEGLVNSLRQQWDDE